MTPPDDATAIDAALQSEGAQKLEPVTPDEAPPAEKMDDAFGDVFTKWFRRFNDNDTSTPHRPHEGTVSWKEAAASVGRVLADHPELADPDGPVGGRALAIVLSECVCRTRHMHAKPTELPSDWYTSRQYVTDEEQYRVRQASDADALPNYFAVEVFHQHLEEALGRLIDAGTSAVPPGGEPDASDEPVWAQPGADGGYPVPASSGLPHDVSAMTREQVEKMLIGTQESIKALRSVVARSKATVAELRDRLEHAKRRAPIPIRTPREAEMLPGNYRIIHTGDGYHAAWYGPPRATEAEAVADGWRKAGRKR